MIQKMSSGNPRPGRGADQYPLRFPEGMRERLRIRAENTGLSMNTVIIHAIEIALENWELAEGGGWDPAIVEQFDAEQARCEGISRGIGAGASGRTANYVMMVRIIARLNKLEEALVDPAADRGGTRQA